MSENVIKLTVRTGDDAEALVKSFRGRAAWALDRLILAGPQGLTTLTQPAPRWSHYVFLLRKAGLNVETIHEGHGGSYAGHHARYRLRSPVTVLEIETAGAWP